MVIQTDETFPGVSLVQIERIRGMKRVVLSVLLPVHSKPD
jgi:hypothetical protein